MILSRILFESRSSLTRWRMSASRVAVVLEELLEVGVLREALLLLLVEGLLDVGVGDLDPLLLRLALRSTGTTSAAASTWSRSASYSCLHCDLSWSSVVVASPFSGFGAILRFCGDALGEVRRVRHRGVGLAARLGGDGHPVVEIVLVDLGAVDGRDGVAGNAAAADSNRDEGGEGAEGQDKSNCLGHEKLSGEGRRLRELSAGASRHGWAWRPPRLRHGSGLIPAFPACSGTI